LVQSLILDSAERGFRICSRRKT